MRKTIPTRLRKSRKHVRVLRKASVLDALFPLIRQRLLGTILSHPDKWAYLSELARELGTTASSLQREVHALVSAGVFEQRRDTTRIYFRSRRASPIFPELARMFRKTGGVTLKVSPKMRTPISVLPGNTRPHRKRKHPGVNAIKRGTPLARGRAVQIMCYPRPQTKATIVEAARAAARSLSSFILVAALEKIAAAKHCEISDLIPESEWQQYV
jgi:hypothetical protein